MKRARQARWRAGLQAVLRGEGQDLVEYALLVGLLAFGVTAGLHSVAQSVNGIFTAIGNILSSAT